MVELSENTKKIEKAIRSIPKGMVSTYGAIAQVAGIPRGARQVARILHARGSVAALPWHRVMGKGTRAGTAKISLTGSGFDEQRLLLLSEGVAVEMDGSVDFKRFGWPNGYGSLGACGSSTSGR
jgi:methylated-DNA-protein-cysteine methyltransferase-like protein